MHADRYPAVTTDWRLKPNRIWARDDAGLDPIAAHTMADVLRARADAGGAVLFSSHQLDVVEGLCKDVVIINEGRVILAGDVNRLRASSPRRYLDVVYADDTTAAALDSLPTLDVVEKRDNQVRFLVEVDVDLAELAGAVAAAGEVQQFALEPPPLSEVFREVVQP